MDKTKKLVQIKGTIKNHKREINNMKGLQIFKFMGIKLACLNVQIWLYGLMKRQSDPEPSGLRLFSFAYSRPKVN